MSLHVLAYNLKRAMKIMGTGLLIEALRADPGPDRSLHEAPVGDRPARTIDVAMSYHTASARSGNARIRATLLKAVV